MNSTNPAPSSSPSRIRRDGWTVDRQVKFILALHKTRSVSRAAAAAGMSRETAYRLRKRAGHEDFARAWDAAVASKGHSAPPEGHTRARPARANSPRQGHESHAGEQTARGCTLRPLPSAPDDAPRVRARGTGNFGNFRLAQPGQLPFMLAKATLGDLEGSAG